MVLTDESLAFFSTRQAYVRNALASSTAVAPFQYEDESFFNAYEALRKVWVNRVSARQVATKNNIARQSLKNLENNFLQYGTVGFLSDISSVQVDPLLERLVKIVRSARPHTVSKNILTLANALEIPGASLEKIHRIQRCHGYGQRQDEGDVEFFGQLQKILQSVEYQKNSAINMKRDIHRRADTFFNYDLDSFQIRVELFRELSGVHKKRQIREVIKKYGISPNRFYSLKDRYRLFGVWGLIDLVHVSRRVGEKISPELELTIIENRLMDPSLSTREAIKRFDLKCSQTNIQKIYKRWRLSQFTQAVSIRGVLAAPPSTKDINEIHQSARMRFKNLIKDASLKVDSNFTKLLKTLSYRSVPICNPGAIVVAPLLEQLGIVEAINAHGPMTMRTTDISNDIIVNILRIVTGYPTVNNYMQNTDRSVAIGSGILQKPKKSMFYRHLDDFEFKHLQRLRNDLAIRAKELHITECKEIAIDYHCDPSDSRFPLDQGLSRAPDKSGNMVYAHRPQIIWDCMTNSIINITYCEGRSRGPSSLYQFLEQNLFKVIDSDAIEEIYADSEYTGEKQLVYLLMRTHANVTMCLKQNKKIKKWKEETIKIADWKPYGENYRNASQDILLPETGKSFRFVVKQNTQTNEVRCFGSTHTDLSPNQILDLYHIRWPVETGIKDLIENYFLNKPLGTSPEKVETHYYCIMAARLLIDYFKQVFSVPQWKITEDWESTLGSIRTMLFSNQNCKLSLADNGDLQITYLDGDPLGIKEALRQKFVKRSELGMNKVSWWGGRGLQVAIEDHYNLTVAGSGLT